MGKAIDYTGYKFKTWVVIKRLEKDQIKVLNKCKKPVWLLKCNCGNEIEVESVQIKRGNVICKKCENNYSLKDLTNKRFGKLTVLRRVENDGIWVQWLCKCDCGNEKIVRANYLQSGHTKSCGCLKTNNNLKFKNLIGEKFGRITIINDYRDENLIRHTIGKCECGTVKEYLPKNLKKGTTKSCGCLKSELLKDGAENLIGMKFGKWTVLKEMEERKNGNIYWLCECDCGTIRSVNGDSLKRGINKSCGCLRKEKTNKRIKNNIGKRFNRWTIISYDCGTGDNERYICKCECGNIRSVLYENLRKNLSVSCGCYKSELAHSRMAKNSANWNGLSDLSYYLRHCITDWKKDSLKKDNYRCIITKENNRDLVVHHIFSFRGIVLETLKKSNLKLYENINDYTQEELELLYKNCRDLHYKYGLGVCLSKAMHYEFHKLYGTKNFTPNDFYEFYKNKTGKEFKIK